MSTQRLSGVGELIENPVTGRSDARGRPRPAFPNTTTVTADADQEDTKVQYHEVRELLLRQWKYTGGPNEAKASELYHDDALLEFPQSGSASAARPTSRAGASGTRRGSTSSRARSAAPGTSGSPRAA
jgi:hypothetical protein